MSAVEILFQNHAKNLEARRGKFEDLSCDRIEQSALVVEGQQHLDNADLIAGTAIDNSVTGTVCEPAAATAYTLNISSTDTDLRNGFFKRITNNGGAGSTLTVHSTAVPADFADGVIYPGEFADLYYNVQDDGTSFKWSIQLGGGSGIWEHVTADPSDGDFVRLDSANIDYDGDEGFVVPAQTMSNVAGGTRFFFDGSTGAVRGGTTTVGQWDAANRGTNSAAFGTDTTVSGNNSFGCGDTQTVSGNNSAAVAGTDNIVTSTRSAILAGYDNTVNSERSAIVAGGDLIVGGNLIGANNPQSMIGCGREHNIAAQTTEGVGNAIITGEGNQIGHLGMTPGNTFTFNAILAGGGSSIGLANVDGDVTLCGIVCGGANQIDKDVGGSGGITGAMIGGGNNNVVRANNSAILAGSENVVEAERAAIVCGGRTGATNPSSIGARMRQSIIGGGENNRIHGPLATAPLGGSNGIFCGVDHEIGNPGSNILINNNVICGGRICGIGFDVATTLAGQVFQNNFIGAGDELFITGDVNTGVEDSALIAGETQTVSGSYCIIGAGIGNWIQLGCERCGIICGDSNRIGNGAGFVGDRCGILCGTRNLIAQSTNVDHSAILTGVDCRIETNANGASAICCGRTNRISCDSAFIGGGDNHTIDDDCGSSAITGGDTNTIGVGTASQSDFIGAGSNNSIGTVDDTFWSAIVAGQTNVITRGNQHFIGSGQQNSVQPNASLNADAIVSGQGNTIAGQRCIIGNGLTNFIGSAAFRGDECGIFSGRRNQIAQTTDVVGGVILGGFDGRIESDGNGCSAICCGRTNQIYCDSSIICGGDNQYIDSDCGDSGIVAGVNNRIGNGTSSQFNFIGAGDLHNIGNTDDTFRSGIVAGTTNTITSGQYHFIGAGSTNSISTTNDNYDTIVNGSVNQINNAAYCTILGGSNGVCSADRATILGGDNVQITATNSCAWTDGTALTVNNPGEFHIVASGGLYVGSAATNTQLVLRNAAPGMGGGAAALGNVPAGAGAAQATWLTVTYNAITSYIPIWQ